MQKVDPIIRTKLHRPYTRPDLVSRTRLEEKVTQGLSGPLTLVTAPAGFGKTTLVAACVAACGLPVAWLSLDKNDNLLSRFLRYLVAAFEEVNPIIGSEAAKLLAEQAPPEVILTSLINTVEAASCDITLVCDDYQLITNPSVHDQFAFLLDHCPRSLHIVIVTRSDPPLPVSRLRARGQVVEIRAADLRFTDNETVQFLNDVMGLNLDARSVAVLEERTEGWIAGLQMASLALKSKLSLPGGYSTSDPQRASAFIEAFSGTNRFIMDFMLEEVLTREPEDVQAFLLQTSFLNRLSGPLCDAVTGAAGSQAMLEQLERRNLFVMPLDSDRRWFRYHHLFADLLLARLNQSDPEQAAHLLLRAADWCEQEGLIVEAVNYLLAARAHDRVAMLIVRYWQPLTNTGEIETVWSWLHALPGYIVKNNAFISLIFGRMLWLTGQDQAIESHLEDAARALETLNTLQGAGGQNADFVAAFPQIFALLPAELAGLRSNVARHHGDFDAARAHAERALQLIPKNMPPQIDAQMRAVFSMPLAVAYDGAGDLEKAVSAYTETVRLSRLNGNAVGITGTTYRLAAVLRLLGRLRAAGTACQDALKFLSAEGLDQLPAAGILHVAISEILVEKNDLPHAEEHLALGLALGKWSGRIKTVIYSCYAQSRIRQARRDASGALAAVQEAISALGENSSRLLKAEVLAHKARVLARQNALSEARQCIEEAHRLVNGDRGQAGEAVALGACRVIVAGCSPVEAAEKLSPAIAAAHKCGRPGAAIELRILRSLAYLRQNKFIEAETDLANALAAAQPEGFARIFIDEGQPMQLLLARWLSHNVGGSLQDYALQLRNQLDRELGLAPAFQKKTGPSGELIEPEVQSANAMLIEPLSGREMEVLHLMAQGKTNAEIARQFVVATGTVKAQAASIYRKLEVANRTEAVARARQLGLLL